MSIFQAIKVLLRVAREETEKNNIIFFKAFWVSFRGHKKDEPRPDWYPLAVELKIANEHPRLFYMGDPPPPGAQAIRVKPLKAFYESQFIRICMEMQQFNFV